MDDKRLSHKKPVVISEIVKTVNKNFGYIYVVRGNTHTFLGMNIDIKDSIIQVYIVNQLEECISMFVKDAITSVSFQENKNFFGVREDANKLSEKKGELYHSLVANFLFIMKIFRPDLETDVSFLTNRVSNRDVDDWGKLRRILRFIYCILKENPIWSDKYRQNIYMGG